MIEAGLYSRLTSDAGIFAIVANRVYPFTAPQGAVLPRITYARTGSSRQKTFDGADGIVSASIQVDVWSKDYKQAKALGALIRLSVDGFRGTWAANVVQACFVSGEQDIYEPPANADEAGVHRVSFDLDVHFEESKPVF